jgi:hypothetical protein
MVRRVFLGATPLLAAAFLCVVPAGASAATLTVNCTADSAALASALATASDGDTLTIQGTCTGKFEIAHSLTLQGSGGATLDGQGTEPILRVDAGKTVVVNDLTVTNGYPAAQFVIDFGIVNFGTLTLSRSTVTQSGSFFGAGINDAGTLTLSNSTVNGNGGGGILVSESIDRSGTLTLSNSTVSGNSGIGIANRGTLTVTDSTVSGNVGNPSNPGGGIDVESIFRTATLTLTNSTVSGNSGIGISLIGGSGTATLKSTIVASQTGGANCAGSIGGLILDAGYNLEDGASCGFSAVNHSLSNTNPLLDPAGLQDTGGPTRTIALQSGSPAIDAIPVGVNGCGTPLTTDQRGVSRPQGTGCDIGAFELEQATDKTPPVVAVPASITADATSPSGAVVTFTVSASDPDDTASAPVCTPASGSVFPIGTTTVTCTSTDTHGNVGAASFTVHVNGAVEQLADLAAAVHGVGPGTSLGDKVKQGQNYLAANDVADTCATLTAFINQVKAQTGKSIPTGTANTLISQATQIKTLLGC